MINENVKKWLDERGFADRLTEHKEIIDTVEHAAQQIGCSEAEIAKTLSFIVEDKPVLVVMAGDGRVNGGKFKSVFHTKSSMIPRDRVEELTGFKPGGVCPFGVLEGVPVWMDVSLKRFKYVYPAGGNEYTSVKLTPDELLECSLAVGWCDICKGWEE
ncbi:MAG: YbaK/EbsC family protein [Lachnospiraceae bacterium]|nr:YbaK/EbsC family protein [Lachnospiraceae bacterium]